MQIFVDDALEGGLIAFQSQASERVGQRVARYDRKILVAPHQRTQPGIFELLDTPDLGDDIAVTGKRRLGNGGDRLNVVQRAIGIEHNGFDGHGSTRAVGWRQILKSLSALAFSPFGLISSRIPSLAKPAIQRSGVITGQSEPNSILSCRMELM